ncbi:hypothetical protein BLNAU_10951 [Blattamonas nauphoetae]|uniref:Uncharacterized protein n=1 Tax=Blattamonas nauphoetae TaxID=2049346 RepID=A0ABQ9XR68_9EUKA|nr:hypothetical protein BLNAU_10951 [Blattamonas nauphoetae]
MHPLSIRWMTLKKHSQSDFTVAACSPTSTIVTTAGVSSLSRVVVDSVHGQATPLFAVSGCSAALSFNTCKITNIANFKANLVTITGGAEFIFDLSVLTNISTSLTAGSGPTAVEVSSASSLTLREVIHQHCVSDKGTSGALHTSTSSPTLLSLNLTFTSNFMTGTTPNDVLIERLDEPECREVLKEGRHVGHDGTFCVSTLTRFQTPMENEPHCFHHSDFQHRDIVINLSSGHMAMLSPTAPLDTPLIQEPVLLIEQFVDFVDCTSMAYYAFSTLKQNPATLSNSLFTLREHSSIRRQSFNIQVA